MTRLKVLESHDRAPQIDLFIGAVGYEARARHCLEKESLPVASVLGLKFGFLEELDFAKNFKAFSDRTQDFLLGEEVNTAVEIADRIKNCAEPKGPGEVVSVAVDISVMSRKMMANVVEGLLFARSSVSIHVECRYSPATFSKPGESSPMRCAGPVSPRFAAWTQYPERPLYMVMGLGYEEDLAIGAVSYLEPNKAFLFIPEGLDERYSPLVLAEADKLANFIDSENVIYRLDEWQSSYLLLRKLVSQLLEQNRVVAVPFGPKVFAWNVMCLGALDSFAELSVWRFSSGHLHAAKNRRAAGPIFSWRFLLNSNLNLALDNS